MALVAWAWREQGRADRLDNWWLQTRFRLRELQQPPVPDPEIVLVEIDDKSIAQWQEHIVFWGPHLAATLRQLTRSGARLVALDWLQDESLRNVVKVQGPQREAVAAAFDAYDQELGEALSQVPNVVLVKVAQISPDGKPIWKIPTGELLYSLPDAYGQEDKFLGYANLDAGESVVTAQSPAQATEKAGIHDLSFAARIVERSLQGHSELAPHAWRVRSGDKQRTPLLSVPLRADGRLLINYRPHSGTGRAFQRFSLYDVATAKAPDARFRNKIVLIGASYTASNDAHYVPILQRGTIASARRIPGVEIQANLVRTLLSAQPIREPDATQMWLLSCGLGVVGALAFSRGRWMRGALLCVGAALGWWALSAWLFLAHNFALPLLLPLACLLLTGAMMGGYRAFGEERERQQVLRLWGRYQDERLVSYLLQHPGARGGQGVEREVTVLFADLKNFTKTVEHLSPPEAIQMLNRYLELMTQVIRDEYGGFVDKYLGDGLMAQWGAPELYPLADGTVPTSHAEVAVRACVELERRTRELTQSIRGGHDVTFGLRLTLHTGPVVYGWVGAERIELTVIGDTVNVCARLQETAKQLNCEFLVSETTFEAVRDWAQVGKEAEVEIRGRDQPLRVYEIAGQNRAQSTLMAANGEKGAYTVEQTRVS